MRIIEEDEQTLQADNSYFQCVDRENKRYMAAVRKLEQQLEEERKLNRSNLRKIAGKEDIQEVEKKKLSQEEKRLIRCRVKKWSERSN